MAKLMKRVSAMLCAVVLIVTMLPIPVRAAAKNPIPNGWYMIVSGNSDDRVLDIHDNSQANGGNLEIYTKNNTTNQRFYLKYLNNGYYSIRVLHSGKYLHRSGDGSNVHQWDGDGNNNAQWALEDAGNGYYYLRNRNGNYMDNSGGRTTLANNVCMWTSNGSAAQKWKFLSTADTKNEKKSLSNGWYMIESGNNRNRVLDINNWSMSNGGNLETSKKSGTTNQVFYLEYRNNGYYVIRVCHSGMYLHKANSGNVDDVHQWAGYGANNTQWALEPAGSGYYYIRSRSGNYLDNNGGRTTLGNNVGTYVLNRTPAQKWKFISTSEPASQLKISGQAVPGTIKQGSGFTVKGTISSNYIITKVTVGIYDAKGNAVSTKTVTPNSRSFNVNSIYKNIHFGQAKAGTNYYKVWATDKKSTNKLLQNTKFTVTGNTPTYAAYKGVNYRALTTDGARIKALDKAKKMTTIQWTAPVDFYTWRSDKGVLNKVKDTNGKPNEKPTNYFVKGKTYTGIPYSMNSRANDENAFFKKITGVTQRSQMEANYYGNGKGCGYGIDCSAFVSIALRAGGTSVSIGNMTTKTMLSDVRLKNSKYFTKITYGEMKPGDIFLKSGHVMMFAGKSGSNYAVFEADAGDSKCTYNVYTGSYLSGQGYIACKFKGFKD